MDVTELAHWEYRCAALDESIRKTEDVRRRARRDSFFTGDSIADLDQHLDCERWLLEEARYKVTLGRWEKALDMGRQPVVEFLTDLKRDMHDKAQTIRGFGRFIRMSYLDTIIDKKIRRLTDGS
jgi:hypothetical protein